MPSAARRARSSGLAIKFVCSVIIQFPLSGIMRGLSTAEVSRTFLAARWNSRRRWNASHYPARQRRRFLEETIVEAVCELAHPSSDIRYDRQRWHLTAGQRRRELRSCGRCSESFGISHFLRRHFAFKESSIAIFECGIPQSHILACVFSRQTLGCFLAGWQCRVAAGWLI